MRNNRIITEIDRKYPRFRKDIQDMAHILMKDTELQIHHTIVRDLLSELIHTTGINRAHGSGYKVSEGKILDFKSFIGNG
jgi:hypothetical protein